MSEIIGVVISVLMIFILFRFFEKVESLGLAIIILLIMSITSLGSIFIVDLKIPFKESVLYSEGSASELLAMFALVSRLVFTGAIGFAFRAISRIRNITKNYQ